MLKNYLHSVPTAKNLPASTSAVLLIPGLGGSPLEMNFVKRYLEEQGYATHFPNIPGYDFGKRAAPWQDWKSRLDDTFDELQSHYPTVLVAGLCIGAVLALSLAIEKGRAVKALTLLSPTMQYDGWSIPWYQCFLPLAYHTPLRYLYSYKEREPYGLKNECRRECIARAIKSASLTEVGSTRISMEHLHQARALIHDVKKKIKSVEVPTLVIHALDDDVASPRNADFVCNGIGSKKVRKILLDNSYHMITMDNDRTFVAQEMCNFFQEVT